MDAVPPRVAAAAAAVWRGSRSFREVAAAIGYNLEGTHAVLHAARDLGLVTFRDFKANTLRPGVEVVAASPRRSAPPAA